MSLLFPPIAVTFTLDGTPRLALLNASTIIALLFIVCELMQYFTGEAIALSTVFMRLTLTTRFHRAVIAPEGFVNQQATTTAHGLPVLTLTTQNTTP